MDLMEMLKLKITNLEHERELTYQKIIELDTQLQRLKKKRDIIHLVGDDFAEDLLGSVNLNTVPDVPFSMDSPGEKGMTAIDNSFLYVCIEKNTWRRSPLVMWSQK